MRKQMEDLRNESLFEWKILTLIDLVEDGSLSIEKAAAKMNMTVNEFRTTLGPGPIKYAMQMLQAQMNGEAEAAGITSDDDVMDLVKEIRAESEV